MTSGGFVAAAAALKPYQWRGLTAEMVVRLVVTAADGRGGADSTIPRDDPRVEPLVDAIAGVRWRALTVSALCDRLLDALHDWHLRGRCFDVELARLLDESG
jgi:hypothetical protein